VENNIQDQLNRVANEVEGNTEVEERSETNTDQESVVDESQQTEGSESTSENDVPKDLPDEERKQAGAFAAMRKRLKELEDENKALKETTAPNSNIPKAPEEPKEKKGQSANEEYEQLAKRLEEVEKYNRKLQEQQVQSKITSEIMQLQKAYGLSNDQLAEFADQLEQRGFRLTNLNMPLKDMYAAINYDKLVAAEVERAKKEIAGQTNYDEAPSTGPKDTGGKGTKTKDNLLSTIRRVASKLDE